MKTSRMPELACVYVSMNQLVVGMWQSAQVAITPLLLLRCFEPLKCSLEDWKTMEWHEVLQKASLDVTWLTTVLATTPAAPTMALATNMPMNGHRLICIVKSPDAPRRRRPIRRYMPSQTNDCV